jgi:NAD+ kinase
MSSSRLRRAEFGARFLYPEDHDYFAMLRGKLHWSAVPERNSPLPGG